MSVFGIRMGYVLTVIGAAGLGAGALALNAGKAGTGGAQGPQQPRSAVERPVVVELFTSQGCSSCPPADVLVGNLAQRPDVIAITRPVTYWDYLGWRDTLAKQENTDLQRAYARKGLGGAGVYTPQVVVQGGDGAVGSDAREINRLITAAQRGAGAKLVVTNGSGARSVRIEGTAQPQGTLRLIAMKSVAQVAIGNGENGGRKIAYHNVMLSDHVIGRWTSAGQAFALPASLTGVSGADRYALVLQQGSAGPIIAASML